MFNTFIIIGEQILAMAFMVLIGYILAKIDFISEKGMMEMSVLLLKVVVPMIIISSFQREFSFELLEKWLTMFFVSVLIYVISIAVAHLLYRKKDEYACAENRMSVVMPNNGFLAFPLMTALVGELGVFLGSSNVVILNFLQWTYGTKLLAPKEKIRFKNILLNPAVIAVVVGLLLFVSPWKFPQPVYTAISAIGSLNTPLAMIVLGAMLAQSDIKKELKNIGIYKPALIKLILIPLIMIPIFLLIPVSNEIRTVGLICSVTPTATAVSMISQLYGGEYKYSTNVVVITTVLSAVTMPIILAVGEFFIGY